jgi:hypothetical protein
VDFRENLISPCASESEADRDALNVDLAALVARLLLFDTYILQSIRLLEFPAIVRTFGVGGTLELLSSSILKLHCDATTFGQTGQLSVLEARRRKGLLPLGSYSFSLIRDHDRQQYLHLLFQNLQPRLQLALKDVIKLKRAILDSLVDIPQGFGDDSLNQTYSDLRMGKVDPIKPLLAKALLSKHGIVAQPHDLQIRPHPLDDSDFRVETNLGLLGLDEHAEHRSVESALLAAFGMNQRIEEMKAYSAVSGCIDDESPLFMGRLGFLLHDLLPQRLERNFQRVVDLAGVPEFLPRVDSIDLKALLSVRDSLELKEFRNWLHHSPTLTDQEIAERVTGAKARMAEFSSSLSGKFARFIITTGTGLIAPLPGLITGAIDAFLVDKVLPRSGIWTFVNRLYPSLFKRNVIGN